MPDPNVSIIILHLDAQVALRACLKSCQAIRYSNYEIIVVENGSRMALDPDELGYLAGQVPKIIKSPFNRGFAGGNNLGIKAAMDNAADYVLLLNDDTEVAPEFLEALVRTGERFDHIGALGPQIFYFDEPKRIWFAGSRFDPRSCQVITPGSNEVEQGDKTGLIKSDWLTGCCLLMKRRAIEKIGFLDERFFLYWEDTEWGLRLRSSGCDNVVVPTSHIWHKISLTMGGQDAPRRVYHKTRSHLYFALRHAPHALPRLQRSFARDVAWLLCKSSNAKRFRKALAYLLAMKDYYLGRTGRGPEWLWQD